MHLGGPKSLTQALEGLGCFSKNAHSADRTVQAVGYAHEYFSWFSVAPCDIGLESLGQTFVSGLVSLYYFPDLLVDDEEVVIFKKNPGLKVPDLIV